MAVTPNAYAGQRFALEIDGAPAGYLRRFAGLDWEADIVTRQLGGTAITKKNVAAVRLAPGRLSVPSAMGQPVFEWIKASLAQVDKPGRATRSGLLRIADFNGNVRSALSFSDALLTEFAVPAMDASSNQPGFFELAFQAERADWIKPAATGLPNVTTRKAWISSNFKVQIGGLPCARVARVEPFTWRCALASDPLAASRIAAPRAIVPTVPDITLSISMADYAPWFEAARRWFVEGKRLDADEMSGRITLLGPTMRDSDVIGAIEFSGLGFKRLALPDFVTGSEAVARFTVELYVESMKFGLAAYGG